MRAFMMRFTASCLVGLTVLASLLSVLLFPKIVFASSNSLCFRLNPLLACSQAE